MIKPFRFDDIFKLNPNAIITTDNDFVIIDNFFLDFDSVSNYIYNNNVEIWKHGEDTKNFIDYYDCRHNIMNWWVKLSDFDMKIISLIKLFFGVETNPTSESFEFNYFKHLKSDIHPRYQLHPHIDVDFNLLVYLDKQSNGGTAIYKLDHEIKNKEYENLLYDVSGLEKNIIKAKPNRCVIFNGKQYHGGHIDDHDVYYDNWRINLVRFYECILPRP